jgi:hypothetical protein
VEFQSADDSECAGACAGREEQGWRFYAVRAKRSWFISVTGLGVSLKKILECLVRTCTRCDVWKDAGWLEVGGRWERMTPPSCMYPTTCCTGKYISSDIPTLHRTRNDTVPRMQ